MNARSSALRRAIPAPALLLATSLLAGCGGGGQDGDGAREEEPLALPAPMPATAPAVGASTQPVHCPVQAQNCT